MRVVLHVSDCTHAWTEEYDLGTDLPSAEAAARTLIEHFNYTLKPGEMKRVLKRVEPGGNATRRHVWGKTNLVTLSNWYGIYDTYRCEDCGATSKRFGLTPDFRVDRPGSKYCPGATPLKMRRIRR